MNQQTSSPSEANSIELYALPMTTTLKTPFNKKETKKEDDSENMGRLHMDPKLPLHTTNHNTLFEKV